MAVYLINIVLILFWRLYYTQGRCVNSRKRYCTVVALQWILISGLRAWTIGADTENYYHIFLQVQQTSWISVLRNLFGYVFLGRYSNDPGYTVLMKFFQVFSGNYQVFLMAIALCFMTPMAIWLYKYSSSPCTSYLLFSTLFYSFYGITGHRQVIATALVTFVGYDLIRERKLWRFLAVSFAAFLIHKSSVVFVPLYFLARLPVSLGYMIFWAVAAAVVPLLGKRFYGPIALWIGYDESQVAYTVGGAEQYATLLVLLCIIIWILYPWIRRHRKDAPLLFHINVMTLISGLFVIQNQGFMRIQQYFSLFLMITIPEVINTLKREYRLLGYLLFGVVMIAYLIVQKPVYQFFFMS